MAKRDLAIRVWQSSGPRDSILAKDVFHEEKSFFFHIVVFRDGTVEVRNIFGEESKETGFDVDMVMQGALEGGDVLGGLSV